MADRNDLAYSFPPECENSTNVELQLGVGTPAEADWLYAAFVAAGGRGEGSCDTLMFDPVRLCSVQDPFGTKLIVTAQQVWRSEGRSSGNDSVSDVE